MHKPIGNPEGVTLFYRIFFNVLQKTKIFRTFIVETPIGNNYIYTIANLLVVNKNELPNF